MALSEKPSPSQTRNYIEQTRAQTFRRSMGKISLTGVYKSRLRVPNAHRETGVERVLGLGTNYSPAEMHLLDNLRMQIKCGITMCYTR